MSTSPQPLGRRGKVIALMLVLGLLALVFLVPQQPAPPPSPERTDTVLIDRVGLLSPPFARDTQIWLHAPRDFEVVLYLDAAPPDGPLPAWTTRTAIEWGVGRAQHDRGLVVFIFSDARLARIEVGYGLEGRLPDAWLQQMLQATLVPAFAKGRHEAGIEALLEALQARLAADGGAADDAAGVGRSAWSRTWDDAWNHGARLLPALLDFFRQASAAERLGLLVFALPLLLFIVSGAAAAVVTLQEMARLPRWMQALRAGPPYVGDLPEIVARAGPRWGLLVMLVPVSLGIFAAWMSTAVAIFIFSMAPDHLTRQGQYGGGGATVTWPAPTRAP